MIKNNIRKLRRSQDLSQQKLAAILGVKQGLISKWELGKEAPAEENVNDMADYFGVSPAYVLGKSQTMYDKNILNFDASSVPRIMMNVTCFKSSGVSRKMGKHTF